MIHDRSCIRVKPDPGERVTVHSFMPCLIARSCWRAKRECVHRTSKLNIEVKRMGAVSGRGTVNRELRTMLRWCPPPGLRAADGCFWLKPRHFVPKGRYFGKRTGYFAKIPRSSAKRPGSSAKRPRSCGRGNGSSGGRTRSFARGDGLFGRETRSPGMRPGLFGETTMVVCRADRGPWRSGAWRIAMK